METETAPTYATVSTYSSVFAKNSDGKFAVFFSNHQKDKNLFDEQGTPWLDSMEQIFAWNHLFNFNPASFGMNEDFAEYHKEYVFKKLSGEEISRLAVLGRRVRHGNITFDGSKPKDPAIGDLAEMEVVDYDTLVRPLKKVDESTKESTVE